MGLVEDRLRERDHQAQQARDIKALEEYNKCVDKISCIMPELIRLIQKNPPDGYYWFTFDDVAVAAWNLSYFFKEDEERVYCRDVFVTSDGRIAAKVEGGVYSTYDSGFSKASAASEIVTFYSFKMRELSEALDVFLNRLLPKVSPQPPTPRRKWWQF